MVNPERIILGKWLYCNELFFTPLKLFEELRTHTTHWALPSFRKVLEVCSCPYTCMGIPCGFTIDITACLTFPYHDQTSLS